MNHDPEPGSIGRKALDLLVYAPAGFIATAAEDLPAMVEKGRARLEGRVRSARAVGEMVVTFGRQDLARRFGRTPAPSAPGPAPEPEPESAVDHVSAETPPGPAHHAVEPDTPTGKPEPGADHVSAETPPSSVDGAGEPGTAVGGREAGTEHVSAETPTGSAAPQPAGGGPGSPLLAIPDYDTLSASQVVRRLDGLGPEELDAVRRHEAAGRGRRTILHRAEQLLEPGGGAGAATSGSPS